MKRTGILLVLFLLLAGAAAWYFTSEQETGNKANLDSAWDRKFKVDNVDDIHKIFIAQRSGETATLERRNGYWLYDGKHRALPNAMDNLLRALGEMKMKFIPSTAAVPNIVSSLAARGIKVELYDAQDERMKAFYIGSGTNDERGTYAIMEGSEQPYVIHLASWDGNLRFRFNLKNDEWRDKTVFRYNVDEVEAVSIEYPKQKNNSFRLMKKGGEFDVQPFYDIQPKYQGTVSQSRVEGFLTTLKQVGAEAFETGNSVRDSVLRSVPFSVVTIKRTDGNEKRVQFFGIEIKGQEYHEDFGYRTKNYIERYLTDVNGEDFMLTQHRVFKDVFWAYENFFQ